MNQTQSIKLDDGRRALCKTNDAAPPGFFAAEAAGLAALRERGMPVPEVYDVGPDRILLEWIETGDPSPSGWETAGDRLAEVHRQCVDRFGFECDTFCGDSRQPNRVDSDGFRFYREQRYQPQIERAYEQHLLERDEVHQLERLVSRLSDWIPEQAPALLHGDLWSGNLMFDVHGRPVAIDPACYWGWPEADLAMTHAFGGFKDVFYRAYQAARPLDPGFNDRIELYNLYHWLNHLNMFGRGYHGRVAAVIERYG